MWAKWPVSKQFAYTADECSHQLTVFCQRINSGETNHDWWRIVNCRTVVRELWGNRGCSVYCKMRGHSDGACAWDTESGAFDCHCDSELRGIRFAWQMKGEIQCECS